METLRNALVRSGGQPLGAEFANEVSREVRSHAPTKSPVKCLCGDLSKYLNTVTTADLRNHFRRVSAWLDNGESVEIDKRGKPYATLLPTVRMMPSTSGIMSLGSVRGEVRSCRWPRRVPGQRVRGWK